MNTAIATAAGLLPPHREKTEAELGSYHLCHHWENNSDWSKQAKGNLEDEDNRKHSHQEDDA